MVLGAHFGNGRVHGLLLGSKSRSRFVNAPRRAAPCWLARSSSVGKPKWVITWRPSGV
jgi:hypothetical protein